MSSPFSTDNLIKLIGDDIRISLFLIFFKISPVLRHLLLLRIGTVFFLYPRTVCGIHPIDNFLLLFPVGGTDGFGAFKDHVLKNVCYPSLPGWFIRPSHTPEGNKAGNGGPTESGRADV